MFENTKEIISLLTPAESRKFVILIAVSIVMGLLQAVSVVSIMPFIQMVMDPGVIYEPGIVNSIYSLFSFESEASFQIFLGVLVLTLIVISGLVSSFTLWLQYGFVWGNNYTISRRLLANYLNKPYEFFMNRSSADFTKNILDEVSLFSNYYLMNYVNLIVGFAVTISVVVMLIVVDPVITIVGMAVLAGSYALIMLVLKKKMRSIGQERLECNQMRFTAVSEAFGGIKDVKLLGSEKYFLDGYSGAADRNAKLIAKGNLIGVLPRYLFETIAFGSMILLTLILILRGGDISSSIPLIAVFAFAAYRMMPQLQIVYNSITTMRFYTATVDNMKNELSGAMGSLEKVCKTDEALVRTPFENEIILDDISYSHPNVETETLKDISMRIEKRHSIGIVGSTGAGKTTLVDIILGLLTPQKGQILIDGSKLKEENLKNWHLNLGYVPQFIYLGDNSVTNNIAFGIPDKNIDMDKVRKAASIAKISDFVENELPLGYDTVVGERGIRLSGGQRQRIGIARALYRDPEVLILDEATSSLDGITEKAFTSALHDLSGVKTLVVIAHRFNTIRECDMIYVMEKGRIVAQGTYEELMEANEQFQKMANQ